MNVLLLFFLIFLKRKRQQLRVLLNLNHVIKSSDLVSEKYFIILVAWTNPKNSGYKFYPHEIVIWNAIAIVNFLFLFQFFWFLNNYNAISACKFTCENNAKIQFNKNLLSFRILTINWQLCQKNEWIDMRNHNFNLPQQLCTKTTQKKNV